VSTEADRIAVREMLPAFEALTTSLEIQVTPEVDVVDGPGRIVIGDAAPPFGSGAPARTVLRVRRLVLRGAVPDA
jgi:hypothetical protein